MKQINTDKPKCQLTPLAPQSWKFSMTQNPEKRENVEFVLDLATKSLRILGHRTKAPRFGQTMQVLVRYDSRWIEETESVHRRVALAFDRQRPVRRQRCKVMLQNNLGCWQLKLDGGQ